MEGNSLQTYVIIWTVISIAIVSIVLLLLKYFFQSFEILIAEVLLFLRLSPIFGIYGLASAPDLSIKMLENPDREHLRYTFLFIALLLFGGFILILFRGGILKIKKSTRWIMTFIFVFAFAEYFWEFTHRYLYPEGLKEWINQGKNAEDFSKNYVNDNILTIGVIGRYFQFTSVIWLSLHLYKLQQIKIRIPILNIIISLLGIISATLDYIFGFPFPKKFEILMLFFIPGIAFFLLYWLGVALLTKFKKSRLS